VLFRTKGMGMDESVDSIARNSGYRAIINDCSSPLIPSRVSTRQHRMASFFDRKTHLPHASFPEQAGVWRFSFAW
jgi:hypothetical protein